jgi:hypothetical protein
VAQRSVGLLGSTLSGAAGTLFQTGRLHLLQNAAAGVGGGLEQYGVAALAGAGADLEMGGMMALGAGTLPALGAVGGALLTAGALGAAVGVGTNLGLPNPGGMLQTGVHWMGEGFNRLAHNARALEHHERDVDARPTPMDLDRRRAVGPENTIQVTHASHTGGYEQARNASGTYPGADPRQAMHHMMMTPPNSGFAHVVPPSSNSTRAPRTNTLRNAPLPRFPGGVSGPRPMTSSELTDLTHNASAAARGYARPSHGNGLGRG